MNNLVSALPVALAGDFSSVAFARAHLVAQCRVLLLQAQHGAQVLGRDGGTADSLAVRDPAWKMTTPSSELNTRRFEVL